MASYRLLVLLRLVNCYVSNIEQNLQFYVNAQYQLNLAQRRIKKDRCFAFDGIRQCIEILFFDL